MESRLPGGPLAARPLHFVFLADCSGSMAGEKIASLNTAIREAIPHMRDVAKENPNARLLVRAVSFSEGARWHVSQPTDVEQLQWPDLTAGGSTSMGMALRLVADVLKTPPMAERALPPVLVLVSDGQPTDDFNGGLRALLAERWGQKAVRIAIAIGNDAELDPLRRFMGNSELEPLVAHKSADLVRFIRWASTAVVKSASSPVSPAQGGAGGGAPALLPPVVSASGTPQDVW